MRIWESKWHKFLSNQLRTAEHHLTGRGVYIQPPPQESSCETCSPRSGPNDLFGGAIVLFRQNLIRLREERRRQVQAQAPGSTLVNCQVVSAGIADRQVARARALQDFINVAGSLAVLALLVRRPRHQAPGFSEER